MLSPEQLIISAEAGVKASAENIAAVTNIFMENLPWNETNLLLAIEIRSRRPLRFQEKLFFVCCDAAHPPI
jgi:hypothetical protein